ncbi:M20 family metallopeptidase [Schnuerera ultunensis]|uniref:M20 family metallopeptidase n=1 Tax=Schnuerera ultunensis TaxID=45497 RepID=UPI000419EE53|nr:M20 family metallopeptidase [Schnuerera ultunensis]
MNIDRVLKEIKKEEVVALLQEMIQINTVNPPGNEKKLAQYMKKRLDSFGINSEVIDLGNNRANIIGRIEGPGQKEALLLNGHLDTVPPGDIEWEYGAFSGKIVDGKIYGRGSADMKGGLAAMITAAGAIKKAGMPLKGDLIIAGTAGEEIDSIGAFHFLESGGLNNVGAIVIGEPSSYKIKIAEKGALWIELTTYGKTSHGAFPEKGVNAIVHMNLLLNELLKYDFKYQENRLLGKPTFNISTIEGGVKTNVVPDKCSMTIDIRTVPSIEHGDIINDFQKIINRLKKKVKDFNADIKVLNDRPAVETKENHPFIELGKRVGKKYLKKDIGIKGLNFYTDAAVFLPATNLPAIIYGPGDSDMAHQPNEYITIEGLWETVQFYIGIILEYLG